MTNIKRKHEYTIETDTAGGSQTFTLNLGSSNQITLSDHQGKISFRNIDHLESLLKGVREVLADKPEKDPDELISLGDYLREIVREEIKAHAERPFKTKTEAPDPGALY